MAVAEAIGRSLRLEIGAFVKEVLDQEDTISVEKLVRMAHEHFNGDEWMQEALIREGLNAIIPSIVGDVKHDLRTRARDSSTEDARRERIASVFEHVGDGYSKSVLAMTKSDHLFAAHEREVAAAGHLRWAGFHRAVAALHKNNKTVTGDLPPAQVTRLWKEHIERD